MFASIEQGQNLDNSVMVLGYVIMRVALVFQWLRAAKQDPGRRRACLTYVATVSTAQVGWVLQIVVGFSALHAIILGSILALIELTGPVLAERQDGGTPWHAPHIAERHSLFAIIALGEGVVGTVAALSAVVDQQGWTADAALVGTAGTGLIFGMWWVYFLVPSALILHRHRNRAAMWSCGHMLIVTSIVATGAGMHVAASFIDHKAHVTAVAVVLAVAVPVLIFLVLLHLLYYYLVRRFYAFDAQLLITRSAVAMLSVVAAWLGISIGTCLMILMLAPAMTVVVYEVRGYRHHVAELPD
jgi:low temperature requirement protein LtrA